jgi:hypothetical protein
VSQQVEVSRLGALAERINDEHQQAEAAAQSAIYHALEAGRLLNEAKGLVPHGQWLPWLQEHCSVTPRSAQIYMKLARELGDKYETVSHLTMREALDLITEPAAPISVHVVREPVPDQPQTVAVVVRQPEVVQPAQTLHVRLSTAGDADDTPIEGEFVSAHAISAALNPERYRVETTEAPAADADPEITYRVVQEVYSMYPIENAPPWLNRRRLAKMLSAIWVYPVDVIMEGIGEEERKEYARELREVVDEINHVIQLCEEREQGAGQ